MGLEMKKTTIILLLMICSTALYGQQFVLENTIDGYIEGIFDFDGDGVCEYVKDTNKVYDGATNQLKYSYPGNVSFYDHLDALNPNYKYPFIDFNNDGVVDVVAGTHWEDQNSWGSKVFIYDLKNANTLYEFQSELDNNSFQYLVDFDGDGELEILIQGYNVNEYGYDYKTYVYSTGLTTSTAINQNEIDVSEYKLHQNYPNPFNPTTTISYKLPKNQRVSVKIYDINGQLVKNLVDEYKTRGDYQATWKGDNDYGNKVSSGPYFYQIIVGDFVQSKKMILLK